MLCQRTYPEKKARKTAAAVQKPPKQSPGEQDCMRKSTCNSSQLQTAAVSRAKNEGKAVGEACKALKGLELQWLPFKT